MDLLFEIFEIFFLNLRFKIWREKADSDFYLIFHWYYLGLKTKERNQELSKIWVNDLS